jgi:prevent-host-death family protein
MRYSTQIKPISYVKAHAAELLDRIAEEREPIIITQNGVARAVLMDVHSYEEMQETLALLQIPAIGEKQVERGETYALEDVISDIRARQPSRGPAKSAILSAAAPRNRVSEKKL